MSNTRESDTSAKQAQADADTMGMNEDDEQTARDQVDKTGEPQRDALGNEDGAS